MCGNTIGQDRRFMVRYTQPFKHFFITETLMSVRLKSYAKRWQPEIYKGSRRRVAIQRWQTFTSQLMSLNIIVSIFVKPQV